MQLTPYGGIYIAAGATATTLATTKTKLDQWNTATGYNAKSSGDDGDPAVKGDKVNNRLLVGTPGVYIVTCNLSGTIDGTQEITAQVYKNGVAIVQGRSIKSWTVTINNNHSFSFIVEIVASDCPATIANMPAASTTGFSGASGSLKSECPLEVYLTSGASTPAITIVDGALTAVRVR